MALCQLRDQHCRNALLALGDSSYDVYCAFGRNLNEWLRNNGGEPLFDHIEVDDSGPDAIQFWHEQVEQLALGRVIPRQASYNQLTS